MNLILYFLKPNFLRTCNVSGWYETETESERWIKHGGHLPGLTIAHLTKGFKEQTFPSRDEFKASGQCRKNVVREVDVLVPSKSWPLMSSEVDALRKQKGIMKIGNCAPFCNKCLEFRAFPFQCVTLGQVSIAAGVFLGNLKFDFQSSEVD